MQVGFGAETCGHESGEWRLCLLRAFSPHTSSTDPLANSLEGRIRPAQAHEHRGLYNPICAALSGDPDQEVTESASLGFLICGNSPINAQGSERPLGSQIRYLRRRVLDGMPAGTFALSIRPGASLL